jgi:hypothetical protein
MNPDFEILDIISKKDYIQRTSINTSKATCFLLY